jgi:hypothetical protein
MEDANCWAMMTMMKIIIIIIITIIIIGYESTERKQRHCKEKHTLFN